MRSKLFVLILFALAEISHANQPRSLEEVPDPSPEAQIASFVVSEGFEIELFASDPMIRKPVQMNWDAAGRLWVVSSTTYPHIAVGASPADEVIILEDTNGDGKADRRTLFADGLHIPTGVIPGDGGVYVANSTELLFLKDTDGDGKADQRKIMLSGFGTEDTHHLIHTLRHSPEGLLHFMQSIYIHSHVETPYGVRRLLGGGIWEFRPETRRLEVLSKGLINPWGLEYDRWGQSFATDGAGSDGVHFIFPFSVFVSSPNAPRILKGMTPGQPKQSGLEIIEDPHFPEDWQGSFVTCDFRGNRINRFKLERSGSSYIATQQPDVLASNHRAFRPIDVRIGPDGALYIADWYNPIIQHGEVDFRDPRRDHVHGRIWRLRAKERPLSPPPVIAGRPINELLPMLASDRRFVRHFAKQELRLQNADAVAEALKAWTESLPQTPENDHSRLEAAWARESVNAFSPEHWRSLWASTDSRVRAAALRILSHRWQELKALDKILVQGVNDADAQVRLWALAVCAQVNQPAFVEIALQSLDHPMDESLDFLLEQICRDQADHWLPKVLDGTLKLNENPVHLVYALRATGRSEALKHLLTSFATGSLDDNESQAILQVLGNSMNEEQAAELAALTTKPALANRQSEVLDALIRAVQSRKIVPANAAEFLPSWLQSDAQPIKVRAAQLAGLWKVESAREPLSAWVRADSTEASLREAAVQGLAGLGGKSAADLFDEVYQQQKTSTDRALMIAGLARVAPDLSASRAAEYLSEVTTEAETAPLMTVFLQDRKLPGLLAIQLKDRSLAQPVASAAIRMSSQRGIGGPLVDALKKAGNIQQMDRPLSAEEMAAMVQKVAEQGDAQRGELIYRRKELQCTVCHAIGEPGGVIGPNMVSIGASAPVDYLIESLLDPSAKIKEGYHMVVVTTKQGQVLSGGLVEDTPSEIVIRDAANQMLTVSKTEVATQMMSPASMMPAGLTASLREDEFIDLIKFLSELGREGPYKTGTERLVRIWRVIAAKLPQIDVDHVRHTGLHAFNEPNHNYPWAIAYSRVNGDLPLSETVRVDRMYPWFPRVAQFAIELADPGKVTLRLNHGAGIRLAVGEKLLNEPGFEPQVDLSAGKHLVTVLVTDEAKQLSFLRVELAAGTAKIVSP